MKEKTTQLKFIDHHSRQILDSKKMNKIKDRWLKQNISLSKVDIRLRQTTLWLQIILELQCLIDLLALLKIVDHSEEKGHNSKYQWEKNSLAISLTEVTNLRNSLSMRLAEEKWRCRVAPSNLKLAPSPKSSLKSPILEII